MEIMKFCYLCFDRTKDVYPVVDETFMQKFINFSPGNITVSNFECVDSGFLVLIVALIVVLFWCAMVTCAPAAKHIVKTVKNCTSIASILNSYVFSSHFT